MLTQLRELGIKLGLSPRDFEYYYTLRDVALLVDKEAERRREQAEAIRFNAYLIIGGIFGGEGFRPQDVVEFEWDEMDDKEEKEPGKEKKTKPRNLRERVKAISPEEMKERGDRLKAMMDKKRNG